MSNNPFNFGKPVRMEDFYNRKVEIESAIGFIRNMLCFSVIGERRIGKTSFLQHFLSERILREHGIDPENYVRIYLNVGSLCKIAKDKFIRTIIEEIERQYPIEIESEDIFGKFEAYVEKLVSGGKNLIIVLDEFECIAPILDSDFSYWFRFILMKSNVAAITASRITIRETGTDGTASPLFNIFGNLFLGLFSRTETESMIRDMFRKGGIELDEEEISFLADLSGRNPYFTQYLGYYYYEEKRRTSEIIDKESFKGKMMAQLVDQFRSYWDHLENKEKTTLISLSKSENSVSDQSIETLKRKGFIIIENGKPKIVSLLFQEFIQENIYQLPAVVSASQEEPDTEYKYKVFICHASEDKEPFVRRLAEELAKRGVDVWYDEFTLNWGNSLRRGIDYGISKSRHAIVVLSKNFFKKEWAQKELDALVAIENEARRILPIWHGVTREEVRSFSPILASRYAILSEGGVDFVVNRVLEFLRKKNLRGNK